MKIFSAFFLLTAISFFFFSLPSCTRSLENESNLKKVDTLDRLVKTIDNLLYLDEDAYQKRKDSMVYNLKIIHTAHKDTISGEIKTAVTRYEGIEKNYEIFLKNYPVMEFDLDKHKKTVEQIKNKAIEKKYSQDEFDKLYASEKAFLYELLQKAKTITYNTYSIEEDYRRADEVVKQLAN